ncbi:WGR domain-containing protein [Bradyrhizobium sp. INPA01-394B]|uniref:WGR domain-containing protein n=1 Tax=Bradyrhizobium campsiandrae TaxID=1729892 RepID=A0ABR7U2D1_9BRAD|nr:WGR domain-containing protein [Bradyrhizobium campsiandrae]MBC9877633.1 WGR domain-containing protein [Bradyrhizobium campsiandrae]MBC9978127.1 WGR domain-containing protein [Bradyrhizobium campsiandrae]
MANEVPEQLHLHRVEPARNMRRFYALALQPTLFGGASVIRNWGRIGTTGQSMMETFDQPEEASVALGQLERAKRRRGYHDVGAADRN